MGHSKQVEGDALLDTGSFPGNIVSRDCLVRMNALPYIYTSPVPMTVCSGLDRTCYLSVIGISCRHRHKFLSTQ